MQLETELLRTGRSWVPAIGHQPSLATGSFPASHLTMPEAGGDQ